MQRRPLGSTGLEVSALGLGAAGLGGVYGPVDEGEAIRTVHRAFSLGVTLFDTSPYYGATRSELVLGKALRSLPRDGYVLSTKAGRHGALDFDFSPARLARSLDESLRRLQTDHVDLLLLHDVEFGDLDRILGESLPAAAAWKASGKVRCVGFSGLPLSIFRRAVEAGAPFDVVLSYCHATLFDTTLCQLAPLLQARGAGLLSASPAAMGLLSSHGPPDWHPASAAIRAACRRAAEFCAQGGVELAELALAFACSLPGPAATLCGATTTRELERNVSAAATAPDPRLLSAVRALLAPIQDHTWPQGRPENQ